MKRDIRVWVDGWLSEAGVDMVVKLLNDWGIRVVGFDGEEVESGGDVWWGAGAGIDGLWIVIRTWPPKIVDAIKKRGPKLCRSRRNKELMYVLTGFALKSFESCGTYRELGKEYKYSIEGVVNVDILRVVDTIVRIEVAEPHYIYRFGGTVIPEVFVSRIYPVFGGVGFKKGIVSSKMVATIRRISRLREWEIYDAVKAVKILCEDGEDEEVLKVARVVTGLPVRSCSELDAVRNRGVMWDVEIKLKPSSAINSYEVTTAGMLKAVGV